MFRAKVPSPNKAELSDLVAAHLGSSDVTLDAVGDALADVARARQLDLLDDHSDLTRSISDSLTGLGVIGPLVRDPEITEVMINGHCEVYIERDGCISRTALRFENDESVLHLIEKVVAPLGLRIDASSPFVDARLPDGSRFHAVIAPISLKGPVVTIRSAPRTPWDLERLVQHKALTKQCANRLRRCVSTKANILVCGGAGTGKTTVLGALARAVAPTERVVTIEDAAELRFDTGHVVGLETRPPNADGRGGVTMRDLVRCALRMRPDRLIIGEVRGAEALDMLQALNSGHAGSMATVHANGAREALLRLETLALLASPGLSVQAARRMVGSAISVVIVTTRTSRGNRTIGSISSVLPKEDGYEIAGRIG